MNPVLGWANKGDIEHVHIDPRLATIADDRLRGIWQASMRGNRDSMDRAIIDAMRSAWIQGFADGRPIVHAPCEPFTGEVNP